MRLGLNYLSCFQTVGEFLCRNEAMIGCDTFLRAKAAALLNHISSCYRIELSPGTGTGCGAVNSLDIGTAWPERGEVDANTATAGHDFSHNLEVIQDALATIFGAGDNETLSSEIPMT